MKKLLSLVADLLCSALLILGIYGYGYLTPQKGIQVTANAWEKAVEKTVSNSNDLSNRTENGLLQTNVLQDANDWHQKFAEHFTDVVVSTDTSYRSPNLSVQLTYHNFDSGIIDESEQGKHKKYGTSSCWNPMEFKIGLR